MTSCSVTIVNPLGLHARAAARFVHLAGGFASSIRVGRNGREMDGKSIMGLLLLSASHGTTVTISADGTDEHEALEALRGLIERGLDEAPFDSHAKARLAQDKPFDSPRQTGLAQDKPFDSPRQTGLAQDKPFDSPRQTGLAQDKP